MENFKIQIKRRILIFSVTVVGAVLLGIYNFFTMIHLENGSFEEGTIKGFQFGIIFGIGLLSVIKMIKLCSIIKDDKKLRILYNTENDERLKAIRAKAGMPILRITSILMLIVAVIAGYFNIVVFYTLIIAALVQLSIGAIVKLYGMKTM